MNRTEVVERIGRIGIVPVVVIENDADAEPLAEALVHAGLPAMEITLRTDAALRALERTAKSHPSVLVGAGTVLNVDQARRAVESGAQFVVSPGLQRTVAEYCIEAGMTVIPGVVTPSEIAAALELGLDILKFFPAEAIGGTRYLEAVSAPFRQVKFIPTGGIDGTNVVQYLRLHCVLACGGSWMVRRDLITARRFDEIARLATAAMDIVAELKGGRSSPASTR